MMKPSWSPSAVPERSQVLPVEGDLPWFASTITKRERMDAAQAQKDVMTRKIMRPT